MTGKSGEAPMPPLPGAFIEKMQMLLGDDLYHRFADGMNAPAEVSVRLNPQRNVTRKIFGGLADTAVPWCDNALYLNERPVFTTMPQIHGGAFYVQEAASMIHGYIVRSLFGNAGAIDAADLCAAPGGKTTAVLDALPEGSTMLANEYLRQRAFILRENLMKWGNDAVIAVNADTGALAKVLPSSFDLVIADAPCSGEGMMRKEAEARRQWSEGLVEQCASLQREILDNAVRMLRPGGYLIYSTCTFNRSEDEEQARYLRDTLGMEPVAVNFPDEFGILHGFDEEIPTYRFIPGITRGEGLFVCVMRKPEDAEDVRIKLKMPRSVPEGEEIRKWLKNADETVILRNGEKFLAIPVRLAPIYKILEDSKIRIMTAGTEVAEPKGRRLMPSHGLALSRNYREGAFPEAAVSKEDALDYLRGGAISLPDAEKGFTRMLYEGIPLGWVNNLGNRANNLYPAEWRIRNL